MAVSSAAVLAPPEPGRGVRAYGHPSRHGAKLRELELRAGAPRSRGRAIGLVTSDAERRLERERADQAEAAYRRLVAARSAERVTQTGRASFDAERQPARQGSAPDPAFGSAITRTAMTMRRLKERPQAT